jgi:ABC-type transport system involved in cytochrome bd biosynthesis fused ATPase/permease subunit
LSGRSGCGKSELPSALLSLAVTSDKCKIDQDAMHNQLAGAESRRPYMENLSVIQPASVENNRQVLRYALWARKPMLALTKIDKGGS